MAVACLHPAAPASAAASPPSHAAGVRSSPSLTPFALPDNSYSIEGGVCYLLFCEEKFSKKLAFAFLNDLQQQFEVRRREAARLALKAASCRALAHRPPVPQTQPMYGDKVATAARPYSFIEFGRRRLPLPQRRALVVKPPTFACSPPTHHQTCRRPHAEAEALL